MIRKGLSTLIALAMIASSLTVTALAAEDTNTTRTCTVCQNDYIVYLNQTTTPRKAYGMEVPVVENTLYATVISEGNEQWGTMSYCATCTANIVNEYIQNLPDEPNPGEVVTPGNEDVPVLLDSEPATFSVTIPTSLPVTVNDMGAVIAATDCYIENNGAGPVEVSSVVVKEETPWKLVTFSKHLKSSTTKAGLQEFGFKIQASEADPTSGNCGISEFGVIDGGGKFPFTYDATVSTQKSAIQSESIANVVFVVGWAVERVTSYEDIAINATNRHMIGYTGNPNEDLVIPSTFIADGVGYRVTSLENEVFMGCTNLRSVSLPNTIDLVPIRAFKGCTSLESVTIQEGVTRIAGNAFSGCTSLSSVSIPEGVVSIDTYAFENCTSLTSINLPSTLTTIGTYAFTNSGLTSVTIPNGVLAIDNGTFRECHQLAAVSIPSTVTRIGMMAFHSCESLSGLRVPSSVTSIGSSAFVGIPLVYYNGTANSYNNWGATELVRE